MNCHEASNEGCMKGRKSANRAGRAARSLTLCLLTSCLLTSCEGEQEDLYPARIHEVSGDHQAGMPHDSLEPLVVRVLSQRSRDFLGRRGSRVPLAGVPVTFVVEDVDAPRSDELPPAGQDPYPSLLRQLGSRRGLGDPGPEVSQSAPGYRRLSVETDSSGLARVGLRLGSKIGDWRIEAKVDRDERKNLKQHFRIVSGVRRHLKSSEADVGDEVDLELELSKLTADGKIVPDAGRVVHYRIVAEPRGSGESASLSNRRDVTDNDGFRKDTRLTLGDRAGVYQVLAEVESGDGDPSLRGVLFTVRAIDWFLLTIELVGGALLFLLGVRILANGFLIVLSPYLHHATGTLASNRPLGYLGGLLAGATFQSSSSVTSYLTSFANGGLLTGRGAAGLLLGASVGATVLPLVLCLRLDFLFAPFLAIGLLFMLIPRQSSRNSWAGVFIGAGLVFTSWILLNEAVESLSLSEWLRSDLLPRGVWFEDSWVQRLASFATYLGIGVLLGLFLRTSNLVVIFAILLAAKGVINPATAMPLVIGANSGSALNSFLRAIVKVREAKRVGAKTLVLHVTSLLIFSILALIPYRGASLLLWWIDWLVPGVLLHPLPESVDQHIAAAHFLYNLTGSLLFLTLPRLLDRLSQLAVPGETDVDQLKPYRLDENLIAVPSLALRQAVEESIYLTELCRKTVAEAFDSFRYADLKLSEQVVRRAELISGIHADLTRYLVLVSENQLSRRDASELEGLQAASACLSRIAESGETLRELTTRRIEEKLDSSEEIDRDLGEVYDLVIAQFDNILVLLRRSDNRVQDNAIKMVERLAKFRSRLEAGWRQRIEQGEEIARDKLWVHVQTLVYQQAFDTLFQCASHLAHLAERMRILSPERL